MKILPARHKSSTPETNLKKAIKQYLSFKGWFHFHIRQGLGSYPGIPDIIACKNREVLFIEIKSPKGVQSEYQKRFQQNIEASGCQYIMVKSFDDLRSYIEDMV